MTSVLCPHKILVATATKLLLYDIPPLHKTPPSRAIFITSVCSFNIREQTHACEGRILWDMIHNHHRGTQSVSVEDQDGLWTLLTLPDQGESVEKLVSRATPQSDVSPRFVSGCLRLTVSEPSTKIWQWSCYVDKITSGSSRRTPCAPNLRACSSPRQYCWLYEAGPYSCSGPGEDHFYQFERTDRLGSYPYLG